MSLDKIRDVSLTFEPISLGEMDSVKLMDRVDTKYVFSAEKLPAILEEMKKDYRLLDINGIRTHRYESLYYDTNDLQLYAKHQSGRLNRHKLRFRKYVDSDGLMFFEIKFKNNQGRTIKERVKIKDGNMTIIGKAEGLLKEITPFRPEIFVPKIWVNYSRMTFVNKFSQERLTVDTNLQYIKTDGQDTPLTITFPNMIIAEAKRDKISSVSPFIRLIRAAGAREGAISKYCFGIYHLFEEVKKNNFKEKVSYIKRATGS